MPYIWLTLYALSLALSGQTVEHPFRGITHITRTEAVPRNLTIHIVAVDLRTPGIRFRLSPPGGTREVLRQTTLAYLNQEKAQVAINVHFFLPFPSTDLQADVLGLAASEGAVYSGCESPAQSYALVARAPAINIDRRNRTRVVHCDQLSTDGKRVLEKVELWNTVAGSAQIVTNGVVTIPQYIDADHPKGMLSSDRNYSNRRSWYDQPRARTAIGLTRNNRTLVLFTVDDGRDGEAGGMTVREVADLLFRDYRVHNALNLDGGGSATLAMEDPVSHARRIVNRSSDGTEGRPVGSNLAVFAPP